MTLLDKQHEVIAGVVLVGITKSDLSYMYMYLIRIITYAIFFKYKNEFLGQGYSSSLTQRIILKVFFCQIW